MECELIKLSNCKRKGSVIQQCEWVDIPPYVINDRLIGYDPSEVDYYSIGNSEIMKEIETITEEQAMEIISKN